MISARQRKGHESFKILDLQIIEVTMKVKGSRKQKKKRYYR